MLDARKLLSLLVLLLNISCGVLQGEKIINEEYEVIKMTSQENSTYLSLHSYSLSDKSKKLRPCYKINQILFCDFKNKVKNPLAILPGNFSISTSYIGKLDSKIEDLKIKKGDSIIISFFLRDDTEPLH